MELKYSSNYTPIILLLLISSFIDSSRSTKNDDDDIIIKKRRMLDVLDSQNRPKLHRSPSFMSGLTSVEKQPAQSPSLKRTYSEPILSLRGDEQQLQMNKKRRRSKSKPNSKEDKEVFQNMKDERVFRNTYIDLHQDP